MPTLQHPVYGAIVAAWPLTLIALLCASLLMHPSVKLQLRGCTWKAVEATARVSQQQLFWSHSNVCKIVSVLKVFSVPPLKKKIKLHSGHFQIFILMLPPTPFFFFCIPFRWCTNVWKAGRHSHKLNCTSVWNRLYPEPSSLKWAE